MRKYSALFLGSLAALGIAASVEAAQVPPPGLFPAAPGSARTTAVISGPDDTAVYRTIILDATASSVTGERTEYKWTIDETKQTIGRNVQAIYTPEKPGKLTFRLTVRSTNLSGQVEQPEATHEVVVFERKIVLIADTSVPREKLQAHADAAMEAGVYVNVVQPPEGSPPLNAEEVIVGQLTERKEALAGADAIVVWGEGISGLQALMRSVQGVPEREAAMRNQTIILITDRNLSTLARTARGAYSLLKPQQIIITRKEAITPLIEARNIQEFRSTIEQRDIGLLVLTASTFHLRPWDVLSILVNYMLSHGVAGQTVILLLMLPVIATIFAFLKQVVGITTFGLYTPSIVALSFLALGVKTGLLFLLFILLCGYVTRALMQRWRLLYIPKVAIILTVVSFTLLLLVALGTVFGLSFSRDTVFILLIMSTLAENFINLKTEEGWWSAFLAVGETVLGAILCVFIVQWTVLQSVVLAYPELILVTIPVNVLLGRWTGLRLVEYLRFREVFKHLQEEE